MSTDTSNLTTRDVTKEPKVALCRECKGTGRVMVKKGGGLFGPRRMQYPEKCPQCEGSGRVMVSCTMHLEIMPYNPKS